MISAYLAERPVEVEDILRPQRRVLAALMRSNALTRGDAATALQELTAVAAEVLDVARVSVWKFDSAHTELVSLDLFEREKNRHSSGVVLQAASRPRYFAALGEERSIAAHEARLDSRTSEFTMDYLVPLGITSMLDAPVVVRGQLMGVVCHEHIGPARRWSAGEELLAGTFADFVAMVLSAEEQAAQAAQLEKYRLHLEKLVDERTEQLRRSEESFRRLFSASPVAMVLTRLSDRTVISANPRAAKLFDLEVEESIGRRAPDFWVSSSDEDGFQAAMARSGSVENLEVRLRTNSKKEFWADLAGQALQHEGEPALLVGVRDVTTQKLAEEALRQSRETLQVLLDSSPVPLVVTGLNDAVLRFCNVPAAALFETTREEVLGRTAPNFYEDPAQRAQFMRSLLEHGKVENFSVQLRSLKGRVFWALLNAKRLLLDDEEVFMVGFQDLTQQKQVEEQLRTLATTDALTGAWNRRHFLELAAEELERSERYGRDLSLAMIDADHFKQINDTFGHAMGDEALRLLAQTARRQLRRSDALGRYGGEELIVVLPETNLEASRAVMERVRAAISDAPLEGAGKRVALSVSVGVVQRRENESLEALLRRADSALYAAKHSGRNRVATEPL